MDNEEVNQMKMQEISGSKDVDLPANSSTEEIDNDSRFMMELEFVQMLSNPRYLNYLAQQRYLEEEDFLTYLKYLNYWREPEYIKFIEYPDCLDHLEKLKDETFRKNLAHLDFCEQIGKKQYQNWIARK